MGFEGGMRKNMALKGGGGSKGKIVGLKGGSPKKSFKYGSDSICNNANSLPRMPNTSVSYIQKVQIFLGKHAPDPLLYYAPKGNSAIPLKYKKAEKHTKSNVSLGKNNKLS